MFFRSKIRADSHVHHRDFPLRVIITGRRTRVMTALAVFRPKLGTPFFDVAG